MKSQAHAFLDHADKEQLDRSIPMRDFDGKFSATFDQVFKDRQIKVNQVRPRAPNLNAFIERWVLSVKSEALDFFVVFSSEHFDFIVSSYVDYYHECRPHQGIGNVLLPKSGEKPCDDSADNFALDLSESKCEERLGGLLRHYREAA